MEQQRWEHIKDLLDAASELPPERRSSFLATACADDESLRIEVETLLEHNQRAEGFLEGCPAADLYPSIPSTVNDPTFSQGEMISGRFRIVSFIGRGGMGEVYKAEDTRLHRLVALKFLPDEVAKHPQSLSRFQREAQAASALNHPNICTVYDISEHNQRAFIAMEFLDGQNLKQVIAGHALDLERLLEIGITTAGALEAAHAKGIVHRDIKPENIFVNSRGDAKILDFGVAKLQRQGMAASEDVTSTDSAELTQHGVALGTVAYMSPEQARGEELDSRTDLFSFGLVIYEMATGRRGFPGNTSAVILASLLRDIPQPPSEINPAIPDELEKIISRALEKERDQRYQRASEIRSHLERVKRRTEKRRENALVTGTINPAWTKTSYKITERRIRGWPLLLPILLLVCVLAGGFYLRLRKSDGYRAAPAHTEYTQLTNFVDSVTSPALSPDGRMLVMIRGESSFLGPGDLYLKLLPDGEPVRLTHDDHPKMGPVFTPDGSRIAFTRGEGWDWQTWTVPVLGGEESELLPNASALTWVGHHQVMFSEMGKDPEMKIVTADESRANERDIYLPRGVNTMAHRSYLSPDSTLVLVAEMTEDGSFGPCRLVPFAGGSEGKQVGPVPSHCMDAAWSPDGQWMYFSANAGNGLHLWRQHFPDGAVEQITFGATSETGIAVAPDGKSLVTSIGSQQSTVWLHSHKDERQISSEGFAYLPSLSSDGKKMYYIVRNGMGKSMSNELRSADLNSGHEEQLVPAIPIARYAVSPDGKHVVFTRADTAAHSSIWIWSVDRNSSPRQLVASDADRPLFSRTGEVFFVRWDDEGGYIFRMKEDGTELRKAIPDRVGNLIGLSPDGRWIVATTNTGDSNRPQDVVAYPLHGGRPRILCKVCGVGGLEVDPPVVSWSQDQKAMYVSLAHNGSSDKAKTVVIPLSSGDALPNFSGDELVNNPELLKISGARVLDRTSVFPGRDANTYAFWRTTTQCNLYRISLP
ncbi:MAG: protein kinase domain-containing protein [Terriglobales bacterium]